MIPLQLEHLRDVFTVHGVEHGLDQALEVHVLLVHKRNRRFNRYRAADFEDRVGSEESGALVLRLHSSWRCGRSPVDEETLPFYSYDDIIRTDVSVNNIQTKPRATLLKSAPFSRQCRSGVPTGVANSARLSSESVVHSLPLQNWLASGTS